MGNVRKAPFYLVSALIAVSAFGQSRTQWRTSSDISEGVRGSAIGSVVDTQEGSNRFTLVFDEDPNSSVTVEADSVTTQFRGFGGTINGSPEIFTGMQGFANLRVGDRVDIRGTGRGRAAIAAETITLLGRSVAAAQTGIGQTRDPGSISSGTSHGTTPTFSPESVGRVEGTVRQVNADDGRLVIETGARQMITIRASSSTPVNYKGDTYRISNLEVGDRIRVQPESGTTGTGEIRARVIDVLQSAGEQSTGSTSRQVGNLTGRVTRVDRTANVVRVNTGRGEVRVDMSAAADTQGRRVNASDIQAGDQIDLSGSYSGDVFVASTIRFADDTGSRNPDTLPPNTRPGMPADLGVVTIYATVTQSLNASPQLVVRDTQNNNRTIRLYLVDEFVVRSRTGGYITADKLKENDPLVIKAYRDADGNYIAQTIRQR